MTNRECFLKEISNMSDEELAKSCFNDKSICEKIKQCPKDNGYSTTCYECVANWLKAEYKKEIKLTEAERAILESINKDYKWIARDKSGVLYVYENKPYKVMEYDNWDENDNGEIEKLGVFNHLFQFITWEDEEPYNIKELLKGD